MPCNLSKRIRELSPGSASAIHVLVDEGTYVDQCFLGGDQQANVLRKNVRHSLPNVERYVSSSPFRETTRVVQKYLVLADVNNDGR